MTIDESLRFNYTAHSKFKRIWDGSDLNQRKKYIKQAGLNQILSRSNLAWSEIESNYQSKLRDVMRRKK